MISGEPDYQQSEKGYSRRAAGGAAALAFLMAFGIACAQSAGTVSDPSHTQLAQETSFVSVQGANGPYRLEVFLARPTLAQGRLPIALLTHGKPRNAAEMAKVRGETLAREVRDMAYRGYLAVAIVRRGYGQSDGTPGVATNAPYARCDAAALQIYFEVEADDLAGALQAISSRPDADPRRVIVIGGSVGGGVALALAARNAPRLIGAVNIAGGVRLTNAQGQVIRPYENLATAFAALASRTRIPSLWIYAQNDSTFPPETAQLLYTTYSRAGGMATFKQIPALQNDGHHAMETHDGRLHWLAAFDTFALTNNLPT